MIGVRLIGCSNSGGANTSDFEIDPETGMFALWYCVNSTCSCPRCTCALPFDTTISLSLVSLSNFTAARLFGRSSAFASSTLTAAFDPGEDQFPVDKSTCPTLMRTATLVGLLLDM